MSELTPERKVVEVAVAVVFDARRERVLVCLRKKDAVLGGYWEFPGGKCDAGESPRDCCVREVREEVGIDVRPAFALSVIEHAYPHATVRLYPFVCEHVAGVVVNLAVADSRWVLPTEVLSYRFPEANAALMQAVATGWQALSQAAAPG